MSNKFTLVNADGIIVNHVVVGENWELPKDHELRPLVNKPIGIHYDAEPPPRERKTDPRPIQVSPYQARVALLNAGLLDRVEAMVADPSTDPQVKIAWEYATVFYRNSPFIEALAPTLGLSDEQVDSLFQEAAKIK